MPKVHGPLFSIEAHGSIAHVLTFSKRRTGQQVRYQRKQKDYTNAARTAVRAAYAAAVSAWNDLEEDMKEFYRQRSVSLDITGYNFFVKLYLNGDILDSDAAYYGNRTYGVFHYGKEL